MQQAAADYRRRGFGIVWLRPGEKRPQREGWTLKSQEPEEYTPGCNLGILTGRLSGDVVCVDLDSPEANRLADECLPPTPMVDGRPCKPRSHRWYRVTDVPPEMTSSAAGGIGGPWLKHFREPAKIDFLGTGGQAAVPPSLHESGEQRTWDDPGAEPAVVPFQTLWDAVRRLAIACGWKDPAERGRAAVREIKAVSGHGGHDATYRAAATLREQGLEPDEALEAMREWNRTNAEPPWTEGELAHKVSDVFKAGPLPERAFNDPHRLAAELPGVWRYWHEGLYRYDGRRYVAVPDAEVRALLRGHIDATFGRVYAWMLRKHDPDKEEPIRPRLTETLVNEVLAELRSQCLVPGMLPMPCMLPVGTEPRLLAFTNGLLDVLTGQLAPHTPEWFSTVCIPYAYEPAAADPTLTAALGVWFGGDQERAALAQEWAGYLLTRSTDMQAFMILTGDGCNGKSTFTAALEAMLGPDNVSYLPWEALGQRFQLYLTLGKLVNISDDIGEFDRSAEGTLKWFVGGKPVTFERKRQDPFSATPTARLVLSCNTAPRISDRTEGVWRRALVLPFDEKIPEGRKVAGMDKAAWWYANANMPGILNWALTGLRRLQANGYRFTRPKRCEEAKEQLRRESNPALVFLSEELVADPAARDYTSAVVYARYREWCGANGYQSLGHEKFSAEVIRAFPGAKSKTRNVKGARARYWHGIRLFDATRDCGLRVADSPQVAGVGGSGQVTR